MITADNITNEQIRELRWGCDRRDDATITACDAALLDISRVVTGEQSFAMNVRNEARAWCAQILNKRVAVKRDNYDLHADDCRCAYHDGNG